MFNLKRSLDLTGLQYQICGKRDNYFSDVTDISDANSSSLIWVNKLNKDTLLRLGSSPARIIILPENTKVKPWNKSASLVFTKDPRLMFCRIMHVLYGTNEKPRSSSKTETNNINEPFVGGVSDVEQTPVKDSAIGENSVIHPSVILYENVKIGKNCIVHAGSVLGVDGFGVAKNEIGIYEKIVHIGSLHIGDNVEIFANVSIAIGTLKKTKISDGCKINNNCHIAHNVFIGPNTVVAAGVTICGSVEIGENCWIGPGSTIRNGISIGKNSVIGLGAVVTKNVPSNQTWFGNPAREATTQNESLE